MAGSNSLRSISFVRCCAAVALTILAAGVAPQSSAVQAGASLEERKLPMRFTWHSEGPSIDCRSSCRGWVSAVGVITADSLRLFNELAASHDMRDITVVLDSGGGSVLDAIALGKRWRGLNVSTAVGTVIDRAAVDGKSGRAEILPNAYCESMCVFLLLSGVNRYVPTQARVRVHQIWMGDRADDAKAATYSADDVTIIERDIGRLAHYTFDMGGTGELLALALSVPPWESLRELSTEELRRTRVVTTDLVADVLPRGDIATQPDVAMAKPFADRVAPETKRTAEARVPTGGVAADAK